MRKTKFRAAAKNDGAKQTFLSKRFSCSSDLKFFLCKNSKASCEFTSLKMSRSYKEKPPDPTMSISADIDYQDWLQKGDTHITS